MTLKQTFWVIVLTLVYLCFELAFNARLLDVVGGHADHEQIEQIERFGRSLSGTAAALLVLQFLIKWHNKTQGARPSILLGALLLVATGLVVYFSLKFLVDHLVDASSAQRRQTSQNIVLVQQALVRGQVELDGLSDNPELFKQPAGKAFLAQFPWMASSIDRIEDKIRDAKLTLISANIAESLGQANGFYRDGYVEAVKRAQTDWRRYSKAPTAVDVDAEIARQQDLRWSEYLNDLGRRGWTPSTVPGMARGAVLRKVRSRIPVPSNWDLADEAAFRQAVATKVRQKAGAAAGSKGRAASAPHLPPGLSWPAFFVHPTVQAKLREAMHLPAGIRLQPAYGSGAEFQRDVFDPYVKRLAQDELAKYDAPAADFADGAPLAERGKKAARMAIVPPIALFFSLLGALLHCTKLLYLLLSVIKQSVPRLASSRFPPFLSALAVAGCGWLSLSFMDSAVTQSRLFTYLHQQVINSAEPTTSSRLWHRALANSLHVVAVGQDRFYPTFEFIRTHVLGGITYGYEDKAH